MKAGLFPYVAITTVALSLAAVQTAVQAAPGQAPVAAPQAAGPKPWPDADALKARQLAAEGRPLFATETPLAFTLAGDFKAVNRDRNPNSTKTFPATLTVARADGSPVAIPVQIRTRGHSRRLQQTCGFAPLRIEFDAEKTAGTVFEGHRSLKLGTHCRDVDLYEQYTPREYAAYRIFNLLTPRSFRARLADASYVDAATQKPVASRLGLFTEDDDDVARRMGGRITDAQKVTFRRVDAETITLLTLFEYMIGNTDVSMYVQHNIRIVETPSNVLYPVPYDFDYSGLVNARYAIPAKMLNLTSVLERSYMGPCRTTAEFEPAFARLRAVREQVLAVFDAVPGLDAGYKKDAQKYIAKFYEIIDKPGDAKRAFIDGCNARAGM